MKKINFLYLFILLFLQSYSQDINSKLKNARMGLYVSPTINFISTDASETETSNNVGFIYGWAVEMALNEHHRLESGFAISYKGGEMTHNSVNFKSDYKVQYITIPLFIKMRSREISNFNYFARIGPSINFKIKEKSNSNEQAHSAIIDMSIFLGTEYSLGGKTAIEGSVFFNNNITDAIQSDNNSQVLFHQIGLRLGFLF
ncbi:MAG: hypothetical protein CMP65_02745 [Flavobacteriales bacterium]|nr:hypothetical protein [Flavobacteriales bacterium]